MTNDEQKQYDEAMAEIILKCVARRIIKLEKAERECSETLKHLKNCPKCRKEWQKTPNTT